MPIIANITDQLEDSSRLKPINPPNTTKIAIRGIIALIPSALPRLEASVESVSQALNAASLAVEPKNVITQSSIIVKETPKLAAETVKGNSLFIVSIFNAEKLKIETPQSI